MAAGEELGGVGGSIGWDDGDKAAAHVEDPVRRGGVEGGALADELADRGDREGRVDFEANVGIEAAQVQEAIAGDVSEAVYVDLAGEEVEHGAHVDDRRLEQGVGERRPPE